MLFFAAGPEGELYRGKSLGMLQPAKLEFTRVLLRASATA